jgi:hypothetical protein
VLILDTAKGEVLATALGLNYVQYFTLMNNPKAKIMLDTPVKTDSEITTQDEENGSGFGFNCRNFKLIGSGRNVHVVFICDDFDHSLLHVVMFEIKNSNYFQRISSNRLPFSAQNLKFTDDH